MLTKTNSFSMSMIQLIPNFPVNVNFYSLQQSSAQLPVAVRGKYSADFLWYFSPGDCSCCSTISQDTFKVKLPTIKTKKQIDWTFIFVWKTSIRLCIAGLGTRSPSWLICPDSASFRKSTLSNSETHTVHNLTWTSQTPVCFCFLLHYLFLQGLPVAPAIISPSVCGLAGELPVTRPSQRDDHSRPVKHRRRL